MDRTPPDDTIRRLVDDYRVQCLWFLREDYYPSTAAECERVLRLIELRGDLQAFRRVAEIHRGLSRRSSDISVAGRESAS